MTHRGIFETKPLNSIILDGTIISATKAGTTDSIQALIFNRDYKILMAEGTDVPADDTSGYAAGCQFIDKDVAKGTGKLYVNKGTAAECTFTLVTQA